MRPVFATLLALLLIALPSAATADPAWRWPVEGSHAIARPFLAPVTAYSAGHRGVDIAATDEMVRAPADGVVHFSGVVVDRPVLSIQHADGLLSSYEPVESGLVRGQAVAAGDVVGRLLPGHCSALCLHFGLRRDGEYISPLTLLGGIEPAVLLPTRWPVRGP